MAKLHSITKFLDQTLDLQAFQDVSNNGLQVENRGEIRKICVGVDASTPFFEEAANRGANMLVCHHGISWADSLKRITENNYKKISFLIKNNIALYACHLPLDAHPRYGNNAGICKALGLKKIKKFGDYHGMLIGFKGVLEPAISYESFKKLVADKISDKFVEMNFGRKTISSVGVISGGAPDEIQQAIDQNLDVYVSGEPGLVAYNLALEHRINAVFAGHYATEKFGVRALAALLASKFKVHTEFIDMHIPI